MRTPSIKTLSQVFDDPKEAKRMLNATREELLENDAVQKYMRECYNPPKTYFLRLWVLNALGGFYGIDSLEFTNKTFAEYLNAGDPYVPTIILWQGKYRVQTVADFINVVRCACI